MYYKFVLPKEGSMTADIAVYTEFKENWQYFFNEPTMTPDAPGTVDKVVQVKSHTRRSGPGDPGRTVQAHPRYYARSAKSKGSARPGKTYVIGVKEILGGGYEEKRQFSIQGNDMDILAYARAKAKMQIVIRGENGWAAVVDGVTP